MGGTEHVRAWQGAEISHTCHDTDDDCLGCEAGQQSPIPEEILARPHSQQVRLFEKSRSLHSTEDCWLFRPWSLSFRFIGKLRLQVGLLWHGPAVSPCINQALHLLCGDSFILLIPLVHARDVQEKVKRVGVKLGPQAESLKVR